MTTTKTRQGYAVCYPDEHLSAQCELYDTLEEAEEAIATIPNDGWRAYQLKEGQWSFVEASLDLT